MRIVADENIPLIKEAFGDAAEVRLLPGRSIERHDLLEADVLLVRSVTKVTKALLRDTPVRYVGSATSGIDHVDLKDLEDLGIEFKAAPGCNAQAVVEYIVAVLAASGRGFNSLRFGIVGCGQVGGRLYRLLRLLGCNVVCYDPFLSRSDIADLTSLDDVMGCDVVSLHTPLTDSGVYPTLGMIAENQLEKLPQGALLINAGRGGVVDEGVLTRYANQHPDTDLVLDVWRGEPLVSEELGKICRYMTPHIAGYSDLAKKRGARMVIESMPNSAVGKIEQQTRLVRQLEVETWQQAVLSVFNPLSATQKTLQLVDDKSGFDTLRKGFGSRLEFSQVGVKSEGEQSSIIEKLGFVLVR